MRRSAGPCRLSGKGGIVIIFIGVFLGVVLWTNSATARRVFHWVDARGVIHYSHSPPPEGVKFEARRMPTPRPLPLVATASETEPVEGEPFVELTDQSSDKVNATTQLFRGEVKNSGDSEATNVAVSITVTRSDDGTHCLSAEMAVNPSKLAPGETGTYEEEFNHPCFRSNPSVELGLEWD